MYNLVFTIAAYIHFKPTSEKILDHVVPFVTECWYKLGELLLKDDQDSHLRLNVIQATFSGDIRMCCEKMFWYWLITNNDATWQQLIQALKSVGLNLVAGNVKKNLTGTM